MMGDASNWEVRGIPTATTKHREEKGSGIRKENKSSGMFAFCLMCVGLIAGLWSLAFPNTVGLWMGCAHQQSNAHTESGWASLGTCMACSWAGRHRAKRRSPAAPSPHPWGLHPDVCYLAASRNQHRALQPHSCPELAMPTLLHSTACPRAALQLLSAGGADERGEWGKKQFCN